MKILICGLGSIGKRHANDLLFLKKKDLIFFRERNLVLKDKILEKKKTFTSLKKSLNEKPEIAFICNTTSKHIDTAIECAKKGCHLFIEKPLSNNLRNLKKLEAIIKKKKIKVMIGYNMRFHPLMIKIKKLLKKNYLGNIYNVQSEWSEYLPDWHPWENYKNTYAANRKMGGGCSLTLSHELDSMYWLFGKIEYELHTLTSYSKFENKLNFMIKQNKKKTNFNKLLYFNKDNKILKKLINQIIL